MDAKRRAAIIKKIVSSKAFDRYSRFDPNYTIQNRVWFVTAVVDSVLDGFPRPADSKVELMAHTIVSDANFAVMLERGMEPNIGLDADTRKKERKDCVRRVETIYGVLGEKSALAKEGDDRWMRYRKFIARRRYRGLERMIHQVNPNDKGFMRYPHECEKDQTWRVNIDAQPKWKKASPGPDGVPLIVNDGVAADEAVKKIWERSFPKGKECDGNLLDCANAVGCILLDTLFEAADVPPVFEKIMERGPDFLRVINPNQEPGLHLLWDDEDELKTLFSKVEVKESDFQIGDHVVVRNHPIYLNLEPAGLWSAEHSLVANLGNRNPNSGKGIRFGGHGIPNPFTIPVVYDALTRSLQTKLNRVYAIMDRFFRFKLDPSDPLGLPSPQATVLSRTGLQCRDPRTGQMVKFDGFVIFFDFEFDDYTKPPKRGKAATKHDGEAGNPVILFDIREKREIAIAPRIEGNKIEDQISRMNLFPQGDRVPMTLLQRDTFKPGDQYHERTAWGVPFRDEGTVRVHPLFSGPGGTINQFERKQMPTGGSRYFRITTTDPVALVTRPKVNLSDPYVGFLIAMSAI